MIKPDVPLQGCEPPSYSTHVHIRYNLPVVLGPAVLQTIVALEIRSGQKRGSV